MKFMRVLGSEPPPYDDGDLGDILPNCSDVGDHHSDNPVLALYFLMIALLLGVLTLFFKDWLKFVPYSCKMFAQGIVLGVIHTTTNGKLGNISSSIEMWLDIDPHLLASVFLPALVFCDAMKIDMHMLGKCIGQCCMLAGPGVLVTASVMGMAVRLFFGWDWFLSLTFGAVLGATDPVAVVTLLEPIGAPPKLSMIMAGESHMGDLVMLILFELFLTLTLDVTYTATDLLLYILRMALGGLLFGGCLGFLALWVIHANNDRTSRRSITIQMTVTVAAAYLSFIVAENQIDSNGVIATFSTALVIAAFAWPAFTSRSTMRNVWDAVEYLGNTIIFMLAGLIVGQIVTSQISFRDFGLAVALYVVLMVIRLGTVFVFYPILRRLGYGLKVNEAVVIAWGGVRGAMATTLAIIVKLDLKHAGYGDLASKFVFYVSVIVFLTLLINGTSTEKLMKRAGLMRQPQVKKQLIEYVNRRFKEKADAAYRDVKEDPKFRDHDNHVVMQHVSSLRDFHETGALEELSDGGAVNQRGVFLNGDNRTTVNAGSPTARDPGALFAERFNLANVVHEKKLLVQMRELFLSALRASCWELIVAGVIPKGSRAANRLLGSVDKAVDYTDIGLLDYKFLHLPATTTKYVKAKHMRILDYLLNLPFLPDSFVEFCGRWVHSEVIAEGVYVASCWYDAHKVAQGKLKDFVGDDFTNVPEVLFVISESIEEMSVATDYLGVVKEKDPEIMEYIQNKKIVSMVLEKQRQFAMKMRREGVLGENDHHLLMYQIRQDMKKLKSMRAIMPKRSGIHTEVNEDGRKHLSFRV